MSFARSANGLMCKRAVGPPPLHDRDFPPRSIFVYFQESANKICPLNNAKGVCEIPKAGFSETYVSFTSLTAAYSLSLTAAYSLSLTAAYSLPFALLLL
jgi:hypothetical protein